MNTTLIKLYKDLDFHYSSVIKPPIARNSVTKAIPMELLVTNPWMYQKLYVEFFLFYVLYSHNTRNESSEKVLLKIYKKISQMNFDYDLSLYKEFFYKHKMEYYASLIKLLELLEKRYEKILFLQDFLEIRRVGYKSTALIFNQFFDVDSWPVVDINVFRAYLQLQEKYNLKKVKSADELFFLLVQMNNFCDDNAGYTLSRLLYSYRKYNNNTTVKQSHSCCLCSA